MPMDTITVKVHHSDNRLVDEWCDKVAAHAKAGGCLDIEVEQDGDGGGLVRATVPEGVDGATLFDGLEMPRGSRKALEVSPR